MAAIRARAWMFTINNPNMEVHHPVSLAETRVKFLAYQIEEAPETKTPHVQGYMLTINRVSLPTAKGIISEIFSVDSTKPHMDKRGGSHEQALKYVTKEESRIAGPYIIGEPDKPGQRTDLKDAALEICRGKRVRDLADEHPDMIVKYSRGLQVLESTVQAKVASSTMRNPKTTVIYGETGVGKTRFVFATHAIEDIYILNMTDKLWFDGYAGQKILLIDDFSGHIKYHYLLRLLDRYPMQVEVKGAHVWAQWEQVYITTNKHPDNWYPSLGDTCPPPLWRRLTKVWSMLENGIIYVEEDKEKPLDDHAVRLIAPWVLDDVDTQASQGSDLT